jgi:hypothetical protein
VITPLYRNSKVQEFSVVSIDGNLFSIVLSGDRWYINNEPATVDSFMYYIYQALKTLEKYKAQ